MDVLASAMLTFAKNLRNRAEELGLSNAEVDRRMGLSEWRYVHYASGRNEPDFALLMKIADVLIPTAVTVDSFVM